MVTVASEQARVTLADYHIAEAERRLARQIAGLECCRAAGHDTLQAERRLRELESELGAWQAHRAEISRSLA